MMKFLRLSFVALMAMVANVAMAQEVTLDFSENNWGLPEGSSNKTVDTNSYSNGTYTIKLTGSEGNGYYFNSSGYLMLGKTGATLELPAFNFDVERIDLVGTANASANTKVNIFVGDEAVSTESGVQGTNNFAIAEAKQAAGTVYTLKVLNNYNAQIVQLLIYKKGAAPEIVIPEVENIAAFKELAQGDKATLKLNNAKVIATGKGNVIVEDETGAIDFYNLVETEFKAGDVLGGKVTGAYSEYNQLPQMVAAGELTVASDITVTEGTAPTATEMTVADAANFDNLFKLVTIKNVTLKADGNRFYADEEKTLQVYDTFGLGYNLSTVTEAIDITGVIVRYNNQVEIAPTVDPTAIVDGINNVKVTTLNANAPMYNLAGQQVGKNYKGIVIQNGVKVVIK